MAVVAPDAGLRRRALARFWSYSRGHRGSLLRGSLAGVVIVLARLAVPFPLRSLAHPTKIKGVWAQIQRLIHLDQLDPYVAIGVMLLVIFVVLGLANFYQRLCFARFAIGTVRNARAVAIQAIRDHAAVYQARRSGELVSRLIGDTARAKTGIKSFLIRVLTNALLVLGVTIVLLSVNLFLAQVFIVALVIVAGVTWYGARTMYHTAHRFRRKEGTLANRVQKTLQGSYGDKSIARINRKSGEAEAHLTRLQGLCTASAHGSLGLAIFLALLIGRQEIASGELPSSDLLLFLLYAVLLRAPLVKIVSQGANSGKVLACAERIVELCEPPEVTRTLIPPLHGHVRVEGVKVSTKKVHDVRRRRIGPIDLEVRAGEQVAVIGPASSGKTTLLRALAGEEVLRRGRIVWDELDISKRRVFERSSAMFFLPDAPNWYRAPLNRLLNVDQDGALGTIEELEGPLGKWGAVRTLLRRCNTWDTPLASTDLSVTESKAVGLVRALRADVSLLLLDDPFAFMTEEQQGAAMDAIRAWSGAVLVTLRPDSPLVDRFDRVIRLRRGRLVVEGSSVEGSSVGDQSFPSSDRPALPGVSP